MPRSIKRPQCGQIVWFYANVTPPIPTAALVLKSRTDVDRVTFDLLTWDGATGAPAVTLAVKYYDGGTRPASGQWCTHMRVQENISGQWPKDGGREGPLGAAGVAP
jgi:hypothetical protein